MFLKDSFPSLRDAHINFGKAEFDSLAKELESRDRFKNVSCYANNIRCNVRSFEQTYKRVNHILISGYDMTDMLASVTVISKALSDNFDIPLTRRIENAESPDAQKPLLSDSNQQLKKSVRFEYTENQTGQMKRLVPLPDQTIEFLSRLIYRPFRNSR